MKARLDMLANKGFLKVPENFRRLEGSGSSVVYEIKHVPHNLRLYVLKRGNTYYATHGSLKPKRRQVATEVARAQKIYREGIR